MKISLNLEIKSISVYKILACSLFSEVSRCMENDCNSNQIFDPLWKIDGRHNLCRPHQNFETVQRISLFQWNSCGTRNSYNLGTYWIHYVIKRELQIVSLKFSHRSHTSPDPESVPTACQKSSVSRKAPNSSASTVSSNVTWILVKSIYSKTVCIFYHVQKYFWSSPCTYTQMHTL